MKTQIIQRAYDNLEPGGWLECQELECLPGCDDGTMTESFAWLNWATELCKASELIGRQLNMANQIKGWMEEAGFVDVHEKVFKIPTNSWPKDPKLKYLGLLWQRNVTAGLSGFTLDLFNRVLGKTKEETEVRSRSSPRSTCDEELLGIWCLHEVSSLAGILDQRAEELIQPACSLLPESHLCLGTKTGG